MNPRAATNDLLPFQGSPFSHLGISPECLLYHRLYSIQPHSLEWNGESGIRTHAPLRTNGFQDRLVMTTSISLHKRHTTYYHFVLILSTTFSHFFIFFKNKVKAVFLPALLPLKYRGNCPQEQPERRLWISPGAAGIPSGVQT